MFRTFSSNRLLSSKGTLCVRSSKNLCVGMPRALSFVLLPPGAFKCLPHGLGHACQAGPPWSEALIVPTASGALNVRTLASFLHSFLRRPHFGRQRFCLLLHSDKFWGRPPPLFLPCIWLTGKSLWRLFDHCLPPPPSFQVQACARLYSCRSSR